MDVQAVSTAIAESLSQLGLRAYDYGPDQPSGPAVFVYPDDGFDYQADYDGDIDAKFCVRFLIPSVAAKGGQAQLNALLSTGAGSAVTALRQDQTFGGVVTSSQVETMRKYGVVQLPDNATRYYSAEILVKVYAGK